MPPIVQRRMTAHSGSYTSISTGANGGAVVVTLLMFFAAIVEVKSILEAMSSV